MTDSPWSRVLRLLAPAETPAADFPFVPSDVELYHRTTCAEGSGLLDQQTWDDMLLPQYSAQLAQQTSIFGQQELHRRLRAAPASEAEASAVRVRALVQDAGQRRHLHQLCERLRRSDREISVALFGPALPLAPRWTAALPWLPRAFLLAVMLALTTGWLPLWGVAVVAWLLLMAIQAYFHERMEAWDRILNSLRQLLRAHSLLGAEDSPLLAPLREGAAQAGKVNRAIHPPLIGQIPGMSEYSNWLWLRNVRHYFHSRDLVRQHAAFLRESFVLVASLEADLALARHLAQTPRYCWAERGDSIVLTQVAHPLLAQAVPLNFGLQQKGAFISGQNGIGKSTLLRTVGLNLIVARAFGYCYADAASTPLQPVHASMQSEDALDGGESLYMAELRRARELLALAERGPGVFIIDEIFRGTNHFESISAAAAVLKELSATGKVIVSSHNLVLAQLLADSLEPWCVSAPDGDPARLQLRPGVLKETNGIALLAKHGFAPQVSAQAKRIFDWLVTTPYPDLAQREP